MHPGALADAPQIQVFAGRGMRIEGLVDGERYILVRVVNLGRRSITIEPPSFLLPRPHRGAVVIADPKKLGSAELREGQTRDYHILADELFKGRDLTSTTLVAFLTDSTGRRRYYSQGPLVHLWKLGRLR